MDSTSDFSDMDDSIFEACTSKPEINIKNLEDNILKFNQENIQIEKRKMVLNDIVAEVLF